MIALRKGTAPPTSGREQGGQLGSSSPTVTRRQRRSALSYVAALAMAPANTQDKLPEPANREKRVIDLSLGELIDEVRAALQVDDAREVMTVAEVGQLLGVSASTVWRLCRDGVLRPRTIGGSRRFLREEVLAAVRGAP